MSENEVLKHWKDNEWQLPGINCIVFSTGEVIVLNYNQNFNPNTNTKSFYCTPICDTTIDSLEKYDPDCWTVVDAWTSIHYQEGKIYGGDGAMGNEGFIAYVDKTNQLVWGMFFEDTNPIKELAITDQYLIAINEHSELAIQINLDTLFDIKIEKIATEY